MGKKTGEGIEEGIGALGGRGTEAVGGIVGGTGQSSKKEEQPQQQTDEAQVHAQVQ